MRRDGFTLAETVVAMALFAAAAVALCQAAINARNGLARLDQREGWTGRIDWIRDDILSMTDRKKLEAGGEMELPKRVRKTPKEGDEPPESDESVRVRWEVEILPTGVLDVHQLTITISFEQGERMLEPQVSSFYAYRPDWYEAGARATLLAEKQDAWERLQTERGW